MPSCIPAIQSIRQRWQVCMGWVYVIKQQTHFKSTAFTISQNLPGLSPVSRFSRSILPIWSTNLSKPTSNTRSTSGAPPSSRTRSANRTFFRRAVLRWGCHCGAVWCSFPLRCWWWKCFCKSLGIFCNSANVKSCLESHCKCCYKNGWLIKIRKINK